MSRTDYVVWFILMGAATAAILFLAVGLANGSFGRRRHVSRPAAVDPRGGEGSVPQHPRAEAPSRRDLAE